MKKMHFLQLSLVLVSLILVSSCGKDRACATVIKDCTGTYLRISDKDYMVCNKEVLQDYADGKELRVDFQKIDNCVHLGDPIICEMYHQNEGLIQVTRIK